VIDFIDMVLESNRDLVLRRLTECLGRDRTRHQVAEVTSLGLVQMTRKRVGQGLLEVYSEPCEHCNGRGIIVHADPVDEKRRRPSGDSSKDDNSRGDNSRGDNSRGDGHRDHARGGERGERGERNDNRGNGRGDGGERNDNRGSERGDRTERGGGRNRGRGGSERTEAARADAAPEAAAAANGDVDPALAGEIAATQSMPDSAMASSSASAGDGRPPSGALTPLPDNAESADVRAWTEQEADAAGPTVTATPRRRGRRGASRPAGPPVADM